MKKSKVKRIHKFTKRPRVKNQSTGNVCITIAEADRVMRSDSVELTVVDQENTQVATQTYTFDQFHLALESRYKIFNGHKVYFYLLAY